MIEKEPCADGKHNFVDVDINEIINHGFDILNDNDRREKVDSIIRNIQLNENIRNILGTSFQDGKDVANLCILGVFFLQHLEMK